MRRSGLVSGGLALATLWHVILLPPIWPELIRLLLKLTTMIESATIGTIIIPRVVGGLSWPEHSTLSYNQQHHIDWITFLHNRTRLQGPRNTSVLLKHSAVLRCRLDYEPMTSASEIISSGAFGAISSLSSWNPPIGAEQFHWPVYDGVHQQLSLQWIVDGFGVDNESLQTVFGDRYQIPGRKEAGKDDVEQ
ncbi:unnamed protein product [Protopolystoma xenopodis]|uniref:Uncharacterized protein n=1 Tax=Protopolystoma xenopodis TaxID=117903 RepID=A0A3S5CDM9_9PLAT|nr:unnamed protein product [Protopolystoma xenopodis]